MANSTRSMPRYEVGMHLFSWKEESEDHLKQLKETVVEYELDIFSFNGS